MSSALLATQPAVPGGVPGDNFAALWNVWWFIEATHVTGWPYRTPLLFAPFGTQLALHTHATTHSLLASVWTPFTSLPAAHNIALTFGLILNGVLAYALGLRLTGRVVAAAAAGVLFAASASVQVRAFGHINLVHAWVLPLFALAMTHLVARPGHGRAVLLGVAAALVLYTDYYYAVYAALLTLIWILTILVRVDVTRLPTRTGRTGYVLLALLLLDLVIIAIITATGGTSFDLGSARVSLRGLRNPLTLFWCLAVAWVAWRYRWRMAASWRRGRPALGDATPMLTATATVLLLASPLLIALADLIAAGEYTTHTVLWRSSPPGADLLTMILGHPRHALTGEWTTALYASLGIDFMEQALWLGIVPLVTLALMSREWRSHDELRIWVVVVVAFGIIALGPFLRVGGVDIALPLPDAILRYLPVFSNARIPGRAVVMVQLAIAVLFAHIVARSSRPLAAILLVLVVAESFPARLPLQMLPPPDVVDQVIKASSVAGSVAELPFGVRDGFGEEGAFDHRALAHQMSHERALAGGFVARLAPAVRRAYAAEPALDSLLRVSTASDTEYRLPADTAARAFAAGVAFVVVNRDTFIDRRVPRAEMERAGFRFVVASGQRELYETARAPESHSSGFVAQYE